MSEAEIMSESRELIVLEKLDMLTVFTKGGLDTALAEIEERARSIITDPSTKKGREEIRSLAARLASTRTALYDSATALTEGWRENTKKVNTERKRMEDKLQTLQDEIRKPLTEFENNEKIRVLHHQQALETLKGLAVFMSQPTSLEVQQRIDQLPALHNRDWEEFSTQSAHDLKLTTDSLTDRLARTLKYEADQVELDALRKKNAEREQQDRDKAIADKAREDAEAKALESEYQALSAVAYAYVAALIADEREHAAAASAYDAAIEADIREHILVAQAYDHYLTGVAAAAHAERVKIEQEKEAKDAAEKKRNEDLEHKRVINGDITVAMVKILGTCIDPTDQAHALIVAIVKGEIPNIRITY